MLAVVCKWTQQLQHCWELLVLQMLDCVGSCVQMDTTTPTLLGVVGSADVGLCWQLCANGHNNSKHCWELLILQMLDCVGSCVQMDTATPTLLGVVDSADVGLCWQLCANGHNNSNIVGSC